MTVEQDNHYRLLDRSLYQRQKGVWVHVMRFNRKVTLAEAIREYEGDHDGQDS